MTASPPAAATLRPIDWNMLVLAAAGGEPLTPAQLERSLFLVGRRLRPEIEPGRFYRFEADNYGPFCMEVYDDLRRLERDGLARIRPLHRVLRQFAASERGVFRAAELRTRLPAGAWDYVVRVVEWAKPLSFTQLVRAVYAAYPEMERNSILEWVP